MAKWRRRMTRWAHEVEAPTWILICVIYGGWLALTYEWAALPVWLGAPLGAWLCAWQMSLQHELIHGHPTRSEWLNTALAAPPLNLWLPFPIYREQHLRHHRAAHLTDPFKDPESTYLSPAAWSRASLLRRLTHGACNTLSGRLLLGPLVSPSLFWADQLRQVAAPNQPWRVWLEHAAWVVLILSWVCLVCKISLLSYVAFFIYPGTALSLVRSLAEHRAAERPEDRTAVVENAGLLGLLFLNNNLHILHHERPLLPWFSLPEEWRSRRADLLLVRNGPVYRGYREIALRYALRRHHAGPHPIGGSLHEAEPENTVSLHHVTAAEGLASQ
jgi:fatty acid desaturase